MGAEIAIGTAIIGTMVQIQGQNQAQDAQRAQLQSQARGAQESARLTRLEAAENAKLQKIQSEKIIAGIAPQFAAAGVEQEGTVFDIISNSVQNAERDRLNIIFSGEMRAKAFESGAYAYGQAARGINNLEQIATGLKGVGDVVSRLTTDA